jgi:stage V sporulation protein SpoVS
MTDTTRRSVLTVAAALASATVAGTLAILVSRVADPVFAAIARHQAAAQTVDALIVERQRIYTAGDDNIPEFDPALVEGEHRAAQAVISTVPTTNAGRQALKEHLAHERYGVCRAYMPDFLDTVRAYAG